MKVVNLLNEIAVEINDERFAGLIHGMRSAAAVGGCHGPMCRKYHRDRARIARARRKNKPVPPPTDPLADQIIEQAIADHAREIMAIRTEELVSAIGAYKAC